MAESPVLSNSVDNGEVVLWQYDHAPNLVGLIRGWQEIATASVERFWDYVRDAVFDIDRADTFGLNVVGRLLGLRRPTVVIDGIATPISDGLFRNVLKGRFFMFGTSPTAANYNRYLALVYPMREGAGDSYVCGWDGEVMWRNAALPHQPAYGDSERKLYRTSGGGHSRWNLLVDGEVMSVAIPSGSTSETIDFANGFTLAKSTIGPVMAVSDGFDMSMDFTVLAQALMTDEELAMHNQHPELLYAYPAGIRTNAAGASSDKVIGFDGQGLNNFASAFAWAIDDTANGGIVAGNDKSKYQEG